MQIDGCMQIKICVGAIAFYVEKYHFKDWKKIYSGTYIYNFEVSNATIKQYLLKVSV